MKIKNQKKFAVFFIFILYFLLILILGIVLLWKGIVGGELLYLGELNLLQRIVIILGGCFVLIYLFSFSFIVVEELKKEVNK